MTCMWSVSRFALLCGSLCSSRGATGEHEASRRVKTEILVQIDGMFSQAGPAERRQVRALPFFCVCGVALFNASCVQPACD